MSEPSVILNVENNERAKTAYINIGDASDKDINFAIRYYQSSNRENRNKIKKSQSLKQAHKEMGFETSWDDTTIDLYKDRTRSARIKIQALNREKYNRKNNRV